MWPMGEGMAALDLSPLVWFVGAKCPCATKKLSCFNRESWIGLAGSRAAFYAEQRVPCSLVGLQVL